MKILQLALLIGHTNSEYNEFVLPLSRKHEVTACTYFKPRIDIDRGFIHFGSNATIKSYMKAIGSALENGPYDIVHTHSPHVAIMFIIYVIFHYLKHGKTITKTVMTVHNSFINYRPVHKIMLFIVFFVFKRIVFVSRSGMESFPVVYRYIARNKITFIQNGFDVERVNGILSTLDKKEKSNVYEIISVGRLIKVKDPKTLIKAMSEFNNDVYLTFIGEGYLKDELLEESEKLKLADRVNFKGLVPRDAVYEYLYRADVFVSSSKGEGLPVAVLESLACGCPVVLSDIPPHREVSEGADFIPLVTPGDCRQFAKQIKNILSLSEREKENLSGRCKEYVREKFSMFKMLENYENIYQELSHVE